MTSGHHGGRNLTQASDTVVAMALDPAGEHLAAHAVADPDKRCADDERLGRHAHLRRDRRARRTGSRGCCANGASEIGDHLALLIDNQPEFYDVVWAAIRIGLYVTPINWHLAADEAGYIVRRLRRQRPRSPRVGSPTWWPSWATTWRPSPPASRWTATCRASSATSDLVAGVDAVPVDDEREGGWMFYSSGTTGQPKGILPPLPEGDLGAASFLTRHARAGCSASTRDTVYL